MEATRQIYWNIPRQIQLILYATTIIVLTLFTISLLHRISIWLEGKDEEGNILYQKSVLGALKLSIITLISTGCILSIRLFKRTVRSTKHAYLVWGLSIKTRVFGRGIRGIMHIFIVWGFVVLTIGTLLTQIHYDLHINLLKGNIYLIFSLLLDIGGLLLLIGATYLLARRYLANSERMITRREDLISLYLIFLIPLLGFIMEGTRLAVTQPKAMDWSPVGALVATILQTVIGPREALLRSLHLGAWISHVSLVFILIMYIPYSKMFHMIAAQITLYETTRIKGEL